jgi:hypothetical protein
MEPRRISWGGGERERVSQGRGCTTSFSPVHRQTQLLWVVLTTAFTCAARTGGIFWTGTAHKATQLQKRDSGAAVVDSVWRTLEMSDVYQRDVRDSKTFSRVYCRSALL